MFWVIIILGGGLISYFTACYKDFTLFYHATKHNYMWLFILLKTFLSIKACLLPLFNHAINGLLKIILSKKFKRRVKYQTGRIFWELHKRYYLRNVKRNRISARKMSLRFFKEFFKINFGRGISSIASIYLRIENLRWYREYFTAINQTCGNKFQSSSSTT